MKKRRISPYILVMLSFLVGLLVGGFLLCTPWAQVSGQWSSYVDGVFMATSAICVTGFDCYVNGLGETLTLFGQIVELVLIQIGGLGFITILTAVIAVFKKITFQDRYYLSQATNSTSISHVVPFVRKLLLVTFVFEVIGFGLLIPPFINMRGNTPMAYFNALFHAVSAFNNAGLDLFGYGTSLIRNMNPLLANMSDWAYYYLLVVTMLLIVAGGLSFIALIEIFSFKKKPRQWSAHTKICVLMAGFLIVVGALVFYLTEGLIKADNKMSFLDAVFMSISSRTAGFSTYSPSEFTTTGSIVGWMLMFIGGGPLGTASGIKTTTVFIIVLSIFCYLRGRKVTAFHRRYSQTLIVKSMAVMLTSIFIIIFGFIILTQCEKNNTNFNESVGIYETVSAFTNTGLSAMSTSSLSVGSRIVYTILMFIGRLGPMTMFSVFSSNMYIDEDVGHVEYVDVDVLIG